MERSSAITTTAFHGRGDAACSDIPSDYTVLLPTFSASEAMKCSLVLHADIRGRPYRVEDFIGPLRQAGVREDVAGLGAFQMGHVWLLKLHTVEAKEKLLAAGNLQVKDRLCLVIDPNMRELKIRVHWVAFDAPVEGLRRLFEPYGEVKGINREKWRIQGLADVDSTTVIVRLVLRDNMTVESLPHQLRFQGGNVLVVIPGRAPVCLRCKLTGHIRRDCKAPKCERCRVVGHEARDCVRTYARAAANQVPEDDTMAHIMDEEEAEAAAAPLAPALPPRDNQVTSAEIKGSPDAQAQVSTVARATGESRGGGAAHDEKSTVEEASAKTDEIPEVVQATVDDEDMEGKPVKRRLSDSSVKSDEPSEEPVGGSLVAAGKRGCRGSSRGSRGGISALPRGGAKSQR